MFFEKGTDIKALETLGRRSFLKLGLMTAAALSLPLTAWGRLHELKTPERTISLYNIHTGESITRAVYWAEGEYVPETLADINHLLRDHRNDAVKSIDPRLFDLLFTLRKKLDVRHPFNIISGYRSPETNALLRKKGSGVAKNSLHMEGQAADIAIPGRELAVLRKTAMALNVGGVGYYPRSGFLHVDTGPVRYW